MIDKQLRSNNKVIVYDIQLLIEQIDKCCNVFRATILQLAIPYHIFIIDVEEIKSDILINFFEKLFVEWKLLKIGSFCNFLHFQTINGLTNVKALAGRGHL